MFEEWLDVKPDSSGAIATFNITRIVEKKEPDDDLIRSLQTEILTSYRDIDFYKYHFGKTATADEIREYVKNSVIPKNENQLDKNVRQGDWGEVLACLIVRYFQKLTVPINKLQWKFNKDKAVFGTDLIAFNVGEDIKDIHYYEVKTRLNPNKKEGTEPNRFYISVIAHNTLLDDSKAPTETIADFLERLYLQKKEYEQADKFKDIVKNPQNYNRKFEIFLIIEKSKFVKELLSDLEGLPPQLSPLSVTIVFIDNLDDLVKKTWQDIEESLVVKLNSTKV